MKVHCLRPGSAVAAGYLREGGIVVLRGWRAALLLLVVLMKTVVFSHSLTPMNKVKLRCFGSAAQLPQRADKPKQTSVNHYKNSFFQKKKIMNKWPPCITFPFRSNPFNFNVPSTIFITQQI